MQDLRGVPLRAYEFAEQDKNFLRCVRGEESAVNSSNQAVQLMEILDAIYQSSQSGKEVPVMQSRETPQIRGFQRDLHEGIFRRVLSRT